MRRMSLFFISCMAVALYSEQQELNTRFDTPEQSIRASEYLLQKQQARSKKVFHTLQSLASHHLIQADGIAVAMQDALKPLAELVEEKNVLLAYNGTYNGYTGTSSVSQAEADLIAFKNWLAGVYPEGTLIYSGDVLTYGVKNMTPCAGFTINFKALARSDIHFDVQYSSGCYVELVLGGWGNTESRIRHWVNGQLKVEASMKVATFIPNTTTPVTYAVTIGKGQVAITAQVGLNAPVSILTYTPPTSDPNYTVWNTLLSSQLYSGYSFRAYGPAPYRVAPLSIVPMVYTATYNSVTGTSVVSQADALAQAQKAWANQTLQPVVISLKSANDTYETQLNAVKVLANKIIDLFQGTQIPTYSTTGSAWNKL